ncbi:MAG: hypothetical protein Q9187_008501, partial [Circinaria calcarea]
ESDDGQSESAGSVASTDDDEKWHGFSDKEKIEDLVGEIQNVRIDGIDQRGKSETSTPERRT